MGLTIARTYTQLEGKELVKMLLSKYQENKLMIEELGKDNIEIENFLNHLEAPKKLRIKCIDDDAFFEYVGNTNEWSCPNCDVTVELREE